jgi:hypothetical protein
MKIPSEEFDELHTFCFVDNCDGAEYRRYIVELFEDIHNRDYIIQTENFLDSLEKEVDAMLVWYRKNFKLVKDTKTREIEETVRYLEAI